MSNNDDTSNTTRVQFSDSSGSIYDTSDNSALGGGQPVVGGLHSGGLMNDRNDDSNRQYSGASGSLGNFEARSPVGDRVTNQAALQPTDIVSGPGFETELQIALDAGLIVRDGNGQLRAVTEAERAQVEQQAEQQQQEQAERDAKENKGEPLDSRSEGFLREAVNTPEGEHATSNLASDIVHGDFEVTDAMVAEFAGAQRIAPAEAKARIAHVTAAMHAEVIRAAAKEAGVSEAVAHKALAEARGDVAIKELTMNYVQTGKPKGYGGHVLDYVARLDQTEEGRSAILAINPTRCRLSPDNTVVVTLPDGTETSWANAIHSKKIKLN